MKLPFSLKKFPKVKTLQFPHQELVFWSAGLILFVLLFVNLAILPPIRRIEQLKQQVSLMKNRYKGLSQGGGHSHEELLISLREELSEIEKNLTRTEKASEVLTSFLKKANDLGINVISVRPEPAIPYPNAEAPLRLGEKVCQAFSYHMDIRCSYRALGTYLETLDKESALPFTVDGLEIEQKKFGPRVSDLRAVLSLTIYVFGNPTS